jgi:hypothetical protein
MTNSPRTTSEGCGPFCKASSTSAPRSQRNAGNW